MGKPIAKQAQSKPCVSAYQGRAYIPRVPAPFLGNAHVSFHTVHMTAVGLSAAGTQPPPWHVPPARTASLFFWGVRRSSSLLGLVCRQENFQVSWESLWGLRS